MQVRSSSADRALAQRLEAADSAITSQLISHTPPFAAEPAAGGGYCLFGGAGSPVTHAVGAGMIAPAGAAELDRIEEFYRTRGVPCLIDLCPLAQEAFLREIYARPYRVVELNNVLLRSVTAGGTFAPHPAVERVTEDFSEWMQVVARGFADGAEPQAETSGALAVCAQAAECFLARIAGRAVAGGALGMRDGVAWMFGDATLPEVRGQGLQTALIQARLALAESAGCEVAGVAVVPGSNSHRNYERAGFELVYMRVNVMREWDAEVAR